jgi:formylglycine-generating enzyme required for sulfatase activity
MNHKVAKEDMHLHFRGKGEMNSRIRSSTMIRELASILTWSLYLLLISSCSEKVFHNPVDPEVTIHAPSNLQLTITTDTSATLSWSDDNGFSTEMKKQVTYSIEQSTDQTTYTLIKTVPGDSTAVLLNVRMLADTTYFFRIRSRAGENLSGYSDVANGSVAFAAPFNLRAGSITEMSATFSWLLNNPSARIIVIERSTNAETGFVPVDSVTPTNTFKAVAGPYSSDSTYYFRLQAKSGTNRSPYSEVLWQKLLFPAPSNVQVTAFSASSVTIQWQDNSSFETGFEIYAGLDSTNLALVKTEAANETSSTINSTFDTIKVYYFSVRARSQYNASFLSTADVAALPPSGFVLVLGGTFQMGTTFWDSYARPVHSVTLSSFQIGKYEVTQKLWREVVVWKHSNGGARLIPDPSSFKGDNLPVETVSWVDTQLWLSYLNQREGTTKYRLPTEAEWEYAARGGNRSLGYTYSGSNNADDVAWHPNNSSNTTHAVGTKTGNELGIYDMSGNVLEWCQDWMGLYSSDSQTNPTGPSFGSCGPNPGECRICRGGSWGYYYSDPVFFPVTGRSWYPSIGSLWGFRIVRTF